MQRKFLLTLMTAGLASGVVAWQAPVSTVAAGGGGCTNPTLVDSDDDFLPDVVEWVVLTNAHTPDTDLDGIADFVEVVEAGNPRHPSAPLPPDQDMRVVITGPATGSPDPRTWLHVFYRVFPQQSNGSAATTVQSFQVWLEIAAWGGLKVPISVLGAPGTDLAERVTANDGVWIRLSVPLVSEQLLATIVPCTLWVESRVLGRELASGVKLIDIPDGIASLVPFGDGRFVMQRLAPLIPVLIPPPGSNRVCVLELAELSTGPAGTTYEIVDADCEDANELECAADCPNSIGWTITIPGGTGMIGGN